MLSEIMKCHMNNYSPHNTECKKRGDYVKIKYTKNMGEIVHSCSCEDRYQNLCSILQGTFSKDFTQLPSQRIPLYLPAICGNEEYFKALVPDASLEELIIAFRKILKFQQYDMLKHLQTHDKFALVLDAVYHDLMGFEYDVSDEVCFEYIKMHDNSFRPKT